MLAFRHFEIVGLFGHSNVKLPIVDNKIIIIGYNGIGKSTVLNAFYYLISCQWRKLEEINFKSISLRTNKSKIIRISKDEIQSFLLQDSPRLGARGRVPRRIFDRLIADWPEEELRKFAFGTNIRQLPATRRLEVERHAFLNKFPSSVHGDIQQSLREFFNANEIHETDATNVRSIQMFFAEHLKGRILYLPTYRRIEKDIKAIFPEIEDEIQAALERRSRNTGAAEVYVELVNFGMEDVKAKIREKLEQLRYRALAEISSLTTRYLRDVIRNEANTYSSDLANKIDQESLNNVFHKVDESVLTKRDRDNINQVVNKIKNHQPLEKNEEYVAHYVAYLIEIAGKIERYERPVRKFVTICNSYLFGKEFVFDNVEYKFSIRNTAASAARLPPEHGVAQIEMEDLSSGEKQIVSLFSHLTLDDEQQNYIIIDEPELSLSVDWQQRFLPDILRTDGCAFIGAVTHSPFIFDNELEKYAVDILSQVT
jgi:energy-coupling factor transporter ATP-binding protein EcfA2